MEVAFRESVLEAKARGQAVFLSSHILAEVEALCDRVGIPVAASALLLGLAARIAAGRDLGTGVLRGATS
jgi:ABC-2 type transport system ATP-binding protein